MLKELIWIALSGALSIAILGGLILMAALMTEGILLFLNKLEDWRK